MFSLIVFLDAPYRGIISPKQKDIRRWLIENRHGIQWEDGMVPYCIARSLITKTVMDTTTTDDDNDDDIVVYVKKHKKREWLRDLLLDEARQDVENIEAHYEDIESLNKLDVTHTLRCQKHVTNCALQNVFKIYNWWHQRQK